MEQKLLITSGYNFDGYRISRYIDICSGECALGTGFLSSVSAGFADIFGDSSGIYENKLSKARAVALSNLKEKAKSLGANAIIGVDIDFNIFSSDIIGIVATGTAVFIVPDINETVPVQPHVVPVCNYSPDLLLRPFQAFVDKNGYIAFSFYNYGRNISAINVDLSFQTLFDDIVQSDNLSFTNLVYEESYVTTEFCSCSFLEKYWNILKSVHIHARKYIVDNNVVCCPDSNKVVIADSVLSLKKLYGQDAFEAYAETDNSWLCVCGKENAFESNSCMVCHRSKGENALPTFSLTDSIMLFEKMRTAKEIYEYMINYNSSHSSNFPLEIIAVAKKHMTTERLYGNAKDDCILAIQNLLS